MPYIGRGPAKSGAFRILDDISGSFNGSTTSFALTVGSAALTVGLPETLLIAVDGVIQEAGSAYTISGSNIVFTAAPQESATFWGVELGDVGGIAQQAVTQSASDDSTSIATTAYVDNQIDVQLTAEDLDVTGDSGTIAIDLDSEALAITGGTGITTTASGNAVNIVGHADAHTVVSHSDTSITGAELTQLSGISANVTDTNLNTLTDGSSTTALHAHSGGGPSQAVVSDIVAGTNEDTYTPPDLMKHHPGVAKVLLSTAANQSTLSIYGCSVAYSSTSVKTVSYTVAFAAATYTMVLGLTLTSNASGVDTHSPSTTQCIFRGTRHDNGAAEESINHLAIFGAQ
jgi:hypothetical protein